MKVFLSYASEDRKIAAALNRALLEQGHDVFFDRDDLPVGEEFHVRIRRAIEDADLFVFLASEYALDAGSYTLSELQIVERAWKRLSGRVLPVVLAALPLERLPLALRTVTVLQPDGDVVASAADAVHALARARRRRRLRRIGSAAGVLALLAGAAWAWRGWWSAPSIGRDGVPLVLVPAGPFTMGDGEYTPLREVYVDAFRIDRFEVTVERYAKFLQATGLSNAPEGWDEVDHRAHGQKPIANVDWHDADAYCRWVGRRLPTAAEWEKAARGTDGSPYPWGKRTPTPELANFSNASPGVYEGLAAVGTHPGGASPYGVDDMAGNVGEWVADWYSESYRRGDTRNPRGPDEGFQRELRGAGRYNDIDSLALSHRYYAEPETRGADIGFRCAQSTAR